MNQCLEETEAYIEQEEPGRGTRLFLVILNEG